MINFLKEAEIMAVFHYIPLHGCPAGEHFGEFHGEDRYTTKESERLLRLPLFYNLSPVNQRTVIELQTAALQDHPAAIQLVAKPSFA